MNLRSARIPAVLVLLVCAMAVAGSLRQLHQFRPSVLFDAFKSNDTVTRDTFLAGWQKWSAESESGDSYLDDTERAVYEITSLCLASFQSGVNRRLELVQTSVEFAVVDSLGYEDVTHCIPVPSYKGQRSTLSDIHPDIRSDVVTPLYMDSVHIEAMNWLFAGKPSQDGGTLLGDWDKYDSIATFLSRKVSTGFTPSAFISYPECTVALIVLDQSLRRAMVISNSARRAFFEEYEVVESRWQKGRLITYIRLT